MAAARGGRRCGCRHVGSHELLQATVGLPARAAPVAPKLRQPPHLAHGVRYASAPANCKCVVAHAGVRMQMSGMSVACDPFMTALDSLIEEHRFISHVISALEVYTAQVEQGQAADPADLRRFAEALTEFGDNLHHEKEERVLLPFLVRHGFDWNAPPLPQIRQEHRHELYLLGVLRQAGERLHQWTAEERRHVASAALALCEFQRRHHDTENRELFPAVLRRLAAQAAQELGSELAFFDTVPAHRERREAALSVGQGLIERYLRGEVRLSAAL